jgi:hypothetical protein
MRCSFLVLIALATLLPVGCAQQGVANSTTTPTNAIDGGKFLLSQEPSGAIAVTDLKKDATDGQEIVVIGSVLVGPQSWVDGRAAFRLTDSKVAEEVGICTDEHCETCALETLNASAMVKIVGADGKPLSVDSRQLLGLKGAETVVVQGVASRTTDGSVSVVADGVYIKR